MKLCGVCILTDDAPKLAAFYRAVLQEAPVVQGEHFGFAGAQLAVYNPGDARVVHDKNMSLMYYVPDLMREYTRLKKELPDIRVTSPPASPVGRVFLLVFRSRRQYSQLDRKSGRQAVSYAGKFPCRQPGEYTGGGICV